MNNRILSGVGACPYRSVPCLVAAVAFTLAGHAGAAAVTWSGSGTTALWSDSLNWSGNVPPTGFDSLIFDAVGTSGPVSNNDLTAGTTLTGITFNAFAGAFTLNGNQINLSGSLLNNSTQTQTLNLPLNVDGQTIFSTASNGGNIVLGGVISGLGGITKANTGTTNPGVLTLSNVANTYTGETIIAGGIVNVASLSDYGVPSSLGARTLAQENGTVTGVSLHFRGGTLQYTGSTPQSTNREIRILNGAGATIDASGSVPEATLSFTKSGANLNLFDTSGIRTLTLTGSNTGKNSFSIRVTDQSTNQTSLQKTGAGTWVIPNTDSTYTGETLIEGGILNVASLADYGVASSVGSRTLAQENTTVTGISLHFRGGTLQYTGATPQSTNRQIRMLNGNGATIDASGSTPEATLSFTKTGANLNLFDTGGVRTLTLTGSNPGNNSFSIQLANQSTNTTSLTKSGPGKWILTGPDPNTATGITTVNGGTLVLGKTNVVAASGNVTIGDGIGADVLQIGGTGGNQIADSSIVSFNGVGADAGILRLAGLNETVGGLASSGGAGVVENDAGAAGVGTLTVSVAGSQEFSGVLRDGDGVGVDGTLALTKAGAGTLILSGSTTHSGATKVTAGTLTVNGTLGAGSTLTVTNAVLNGTGTVAGRVDVGTSGTLNGSGVFTGPVNLNTGGVLAGTSTLATVNAGNGSHISPGSASSAGTLTIGSLSLFSGSVLDYEFGGASDLINITTPGGLAINGGAFNLYAAGGSTPLMANGTYTLLDYVGSFTGVLSNLSIANSQVGKYYNITSDAASTSVLLTVADAVVTEWNGGAANGKWTTTGNWTAGTPNSPGGVAKFGAVPTTPTTVAVDGAKTLGGILFDNPSSYTLTGGVADTLTLDNGVAAASITAATGSHTIAAPIVLATSANASTAAGTTLIFTGNVSGSRPFIASGSGTTILKGTNSYAATSVAGGTLSVGDGGTSGTLGTGDVTVENGATLVFNRSDDLSLPNNVSGSGAQVTKLGAGTLTLSGVNTFATGTGSGFNLNAGTVKLASATALATGVVLGFNGGTLDLNGNGVTSSFLSGATGTIADSSATAGTTTLTVNQSSATNFGGTIANGATRTVAVTKSGTGTLALSGNNTFSGPLTILDGTVISAATGGRVPIVSNVTLGDGNNAVMLIAGTADQQFGPQTVLNFNNGSKNAKFQLRGSNQTVAGLDSTADSSVTLAIIQNDEIGTPDYISAPGLATLTINAATNHSFTGYIRNLVGGGLNIVKEGTGTQEIRNALIGTNSFTGLTVNAGKLLFNYGPNGLSTNTFVTGAVGTPPLPFVVNTGGTLVFDGTLTVPGPSTTVAGVAISGAGTVVKQGAGTVRLAGPSTLTGKVVLEAGILEVGHDQALGDPSALLTINGGNIRAASATREIPNPVLINGDFTLGRQTNLNGNITLGADVILTANNPDATYNTTSALGPVSGPFRLTIQQGSFAMGAGAIIVNGQNTNSGGTTITSGRVNVSALGTLSNAPLVVNGGELNINNAAQTVGGFSGAGGRVNLGTGNVFTVKQEVAGSFTGTFGGDGTLVKSGAAALTLNGANTAYFGPVKVTEGALVVNGSISGSVSLDGAAAVLGGIGSTGSLDVQNGATIDPGSTTPGTLTAFGDVTLRSGTQLRLDLNSPLAGIGYDQLSLSGTASLTNVVLTLLGLYNTGGNSSGDLFFIVNNTGFGPVNGTFAGLPEGSLVSSSSGQPFRLTYAANADFGTFTGGNDVALMAIPEPNALSALLGGTGVLLGMGRRRKGRRPAAQTFISES